MHKPNSEILSKSQTALSKNKNSRFQFLKDNFSKASNSIKNKFEKMFSFNNDMEELENEMKPNEENTNDQYEEEEENEYGYEEVPTKTSKSSNKSTKETKEDDNYIYVAENGDLHYVDQEGNVFKCREDDGDFILEEQIFSASNTKNTTAAPKKQEKSSKSDNNNNSELNLEEMLKQEKNGSSEPEDDEGNKNEVVFEEFVFVRNAMNETPGGKDTGKNITKTDNKLERVHKLRDKGEIIEFNGPLFKATKPNQKSMKLIQLIKTKITRYVAVDESILYVMSRDKKKYKVRSATNILSIRKILVSEANDKTLKIEISDINKVEEEISLKVYDFEKRNDFLINLKSIFHRNGLELKIVSF